MDAFLRQRSTIGGASISTPTKIAGGSVHDQHHGGDTSGLDVELDRSFRAARIDK